MGCEQSSVRKSTTEPNRWSSRVLPEKIQIDPRGVAEGRKEYNSYQDMLNGQVHLNGSNGVDIGTKLLTTKKETPATAMDEIRRLLRNYQGKEEEIVEIEKTEPLAMFYIKKSHLESITGKIKEQEEKISEFRTAVENAGEKSGGDHTDSVAALLERFGEKKLSKGDQDLLAKTNTLEIALTELEMAYQERALVENQVRNLHSTLLTLRETYKELDSILEQLSLNEETPEESNIQTELASIESRRMSISEIYERWKEGRGQVAEACRQFSIALAKWRAIPTDPSLVGPGTEYERGEDIRDDLVNAIQCLTNAKYYVNLELPYCLPEEISVLQKALTYLFIDIRTEERRQHAQLCYGAIHKRAVALFAWIDKTIELVIEPDLRQLTRVINEKVTQLKRIRAEEIRKKYPGVDFHRGSPVDDGSGPLPDLETHDNSSLDSETEKVLHELEFDQLAPLPSIGEISAAHARTEDMVESFRAKLREELAKDLEKTSSVQERSPDDIITHRRNTLSRKLLLIDDPFR